MGILAVTVSGRIGLGEDEGENIGVVGHIGGAKRGGGVGKGRDNRPCMKSGINK